jgi:predicted SnoaL-like aldol condensation-catalyzing enzyme
MICATCATENTRATIHVMDFVRYDEGRVAGHWGVVDLAGLRAQLDQA